MRVPISSKSESVLQKIPGIRFLTPNSAMCSVLLTPGRTMKASADCLKLADLRRVYSKEKLAGPDSCHRTSTPRERAADSTLFQSGKLSSARLFQKTTTRLALGTVSLISSNHFPPNPKVRPLTP